MSGQLGAVSRTLGVDPWLIATLSSFDPSPGYQGRRDLNLTRIANVQITRGRRGTTGPVEPATLTFDAELADALPWPAQVGDPVTLDLTTLGLTATGASSAEGRRFTGYVGALGQRQQRPGLPDILTVTAAGPYSLLNVNVGDTPWPQVDDQSRCNQIVGAARAVDSRIPAMTFSSRASGGEFSLQPRDVDSQLARTLVEQTAEDGLALLAETRDGRLLYQPFRHRRRDLAPSVTLADDELAADPTWSQTRDGMVNDLTVTYAVNAGAGTSESVSEFDPVAADFTQGGPGRIAADVTTQHASLASVYYLPSARDYARLVVGRYGRPRWTFEGVRVDLLRLVKLGRLAQLRKLLALETGDLVKCDGVGRTSPYVAGAWLWVEGSQEVITRDSWQLQLFLSPYATTAEPARYQDVPALKTFADYPRVSFYQAGASFDLPPAY